MNTLWNVPPYAVVNDLEKHLLVDGFRIVIDLDKSRGSRLVDAAANKVANDFFVAFKEKVGKPAHAATAEHHDEHHPEPVPRDPDLPQVSETSLAFFAAGALVVFVVSLITLL